jgi:hypothetical protein
VGLLVLGTGHQPWIHIRRWLQHQAVRTTGPSRSSRRWHEGQHADTTVGSFAIDTTTMSVDDKVYDFGYPAAVYHGSDLIYCAVQSSPAGTGPPSHDAT